ncbi:MAG TPA: ATPase [Lachnospiraceae bacterium]|nr:ATPase [Lachnospiraceae bacterium]
MKSMTIEQAEKLITPGGKWVMLDIRSEEEYLRSSYPEALSIPQRQFEEDPEGSISRLDRKKSYLVMCHTGDHSRDIVSLLQDHGIDAANLDGGWRAYLRLSLQRFMEEEQDEKRSEKTAAIERSIIKRFRKTVWSPFTKAVKDYQMIQEGDRIACCISGGKDSFLMAKLLQELQKHGPVRFELVFLCMNPGYNEDNWQIIKDNAKILGIDLTVFNTEIFDTVAEIDKNPCYLCARMRRGYLYSHAKELGCNKIALGHHYDDVIETILMGMLYAGKVETMMPRLKSQHFEGMELIRPLYLIREKDIKAWRDANELSFIQCACRFTENCLSCGGARGSKRDDVKQLIADLARQDPVIEANLFRSVENVSLNAVIGYKDRNGVRHSFLEQF